MMASCRFCVRPRRRGAVLCGSEECLKAYYQTWHRENRKKHPERYGRAFYRAKGQACPTRPPPPKRSPRIEARQDERLERLTDWLQGRWFGATKAEIVEEFSEFYRECVSWSSDERRYYRDMAQLRAAGFVWVRGRMVRANRAHAVPEAA